MKQKLKSLLVAVTLRKSNSNNTVCCVPTGASESVRISGSKMTEEAVVPKR